MGSRAQLVSEYAQSRLTLCSYSIPAQFEVGYFQGVDKKVCLKADLNLCPIPNFSQSLDLQDDAVIISLSFFGWSH